MVVVLLFVLGIAHSYIIFPFSLEILYRSAYKRMFAAEKVKEIQKWNGKVSVIMSCYNESKVLEDKIACLKDQTCPPSRISFYIGSDASSDDTHSILTAWENEDSRVKFFNYSQRRGKGPVINELTTCALQEWGSGKDHVLIFTDANVMLDRHCIERLIGHFNDPRIGVVDSHMIAISPESRGISVSEQSYIRREVRIKHLEGILWGTMMGTFGGCYALRSDAFTPVPDNFIVDDFFITIQAMLKGFGAINDPDAVCHEVVSQEIGEEYRRKKRISGGNFQNLSYFWPRIRKASLPFQYCFISHKLLRWLGPMLALGAWLISGFLGLWGYSFFGILFILTGSLGAVIMVGDRVLERNRIHIRLLRHVRYFIWMNIAVFEGFIQYLQGIETNVWQPPKRQ